MIKRNEIYRIYGTGYKAMTKRLLNSIDAASLIPSMRTAIGIKPNLVSPSTADMGATTHPEIVAGIIEYLKENGFKNIYMLEGSWVGSKTSQCTGLCGYDDLSRKYGVPFFDTQKDKAIKTDCAGMAINICKKALETEFLINVPVLKGHCQTRVTCALKNMKGLITNGEKRMFHIKGLHKPIAHLNTAIKQHLIIVDGICGDPDFEDGGHPLERNCILAAADPVLVDTYACRELGRDKASVKYICLSEQLGVGSSDLEHAIIRTLPGDERWSSFKPELTDKIISLEESVEEIDSCSACYGYLMPALDMLKNEGLLDNLGAKICIGQGYRGKTGALGVGNCTMGFDTCIKGCPPTEQEIYDGLKKYMGC